MVKSKQQNCVPANTKRKKSSGDAEANLLGEDDWIVVKKQTVNIIIPPSPVSKEVAFPNTVDCEPHIVVNDRRESPKAIVHPLMHSPCEKEKSDSSIPKTIGVDDSGICAQPNPASLDELVLEDLCIESCRDQRIVGGYKSCRVIKRLAVSADRNAIIHQRIRTLMIQRKLKQVGGLSKWLVSLGLGRFIKIFQCNGVDKYQLACLTTGDLKEMGIYAVGPRRKLLHAIDHLCQPYCFK